MIDWADDDTMSAKETMHRFEALGPDETVGKPAPECSHPSGKHPYHYSETWGTPEHTGHTYETFYCGYCDKVVRTMRIK